MWLSRKFQSKMDIVKTKEFFVIFFLNYDKLDSLVQKNIFLLLHILKE